ncbi:MAG: N-acetyl sugar amidotransferase [Bacteroidales bacterium]|nr:N-acetyl sugar amidotransferase [Acholeplasmataceae bacterium]MCK9448806.1 N-acetyl sugar amidotransferase [Bacteroidales bacterium]
MIKYKELKICTRCIYDERTPAISYDEQGVCNYCKMVDNLKAEYNTGMPEGEQKIDEIIEQIKRDGKGKNYDCIIGVSGGTDSSYMVYWALKKGLRPLAVHYDNTWNTSIATENIRKVLEKLKVDLFTHVIDNREADDIFKAFFISGVPEIEASTDLALAETMYRAAAKFKVKYVLEGHSFVAEGITPLGKNYFDGKYIKSIHKMFGKLPMKTYPLMTFWKFIKWTTIYRIKKIRPLWYIQYNKEDARTFLEKEFGWQYYGGHHLENRMTSFFHSIYCPQKYNIDYRNNSLSASVRAGKMNRDEAVIEYYERPPYIEPELLSYFKKRLNLSDDEYEKIMKTPPKYWYEFPTYKKRFERLRPFFYLLMKVNLVPRSFYMKYCFPAEMNRL